MNSTPIAAGSWSANTIAPFLVNQAVKMASSPSIGYASSPNVAQVIPLRILGADVRREDLLESLARSLAESTGAQVWLAVQTKHGRIPYSVCEVRDGKSLMKPEKPTLVNAMRECLGASSCIAAGSSDSNAFGISNVIEQFRRECSASQVTGFSVALTESNHRAVVLLAFHDAIEAERFFMIMKSVTSEKERLGQQIDSWLMCQLGRKLQRLSARLEKMLSRRALVLFCIIGLLLLCLGIPIPYLPTRECTLEPAHRSYVSSPIDGQLAQSFVRPGDSVTKNQLLARMDDHQLVRDLSAATADLHAAAKRRDTAMATRASGDSQLALLEQQQIQLRIESIQARLNQTEIRSPSDGVIVTGDWFGSDNASVTLGQSLFEIAPLDQMTSEIRLTASDLPEIRTGCDVLLRADSQAGHTWRAKLTRIEPRAEIIDQKAIFIGEMDIDNPEGWLRPGMKATVRLDVGYRSIGWVLFHQPYRWLMNQWTW